MEDRDSLIAELARLEADRNGELKEMEQEAAEIRKVLEERERPVRRLAELESHIGVLRRMTADRIGAIRRQLEREASPAMKSAAKRMQEEIQSAYSRKRYELAIDLERVKGKLLALLEAPGDITKAIGELTAEAARMIAADMQNDLSPEVVDSDDPEGMITANWATDVLYDTGAKR